jgi:hypothetical protein
VFIRRTSPVANLNIDNYFFKFSAKRLRAMALEPATASISKHSRLIRVCSGHITVRTNDDSEPAGWNAKGTTANVRRKFVLVEGSKWTVSGRPSVAVSYNLADHFRQRLLSHAGKKLANAKGSTRSAILLKNVSKRFV